MLLNHEFFAEGVKIEALPQQGEESDDSTILHLRLEVPIKESSKKNNQESIEFIFDISKDQPEVVVDMMVRLHFVWPCCVERALAVSPFHHISKVRPTPIQSSLAIHLA